MFDMNCICYCVQKMLEMRKRTSINLEKNRVWGSKKVWLLMKMRKNIHNLCHKAVKIVDVWIDAENVVIYEGF